jgi:hypothetical protein
MTTELARHFLLVSSHLHSPFGNRRDRRYEALSPAERNLAANESTMLGLVSQKDTWKSMQLKELMADILNKIVTGEVVWG